MTVPVRAEAGVGVDAGVAAEWAAYTYVVDGIDASIAELPKAVSGHTYRVVVVPSLRRVECVVSEDEDLFALADDLRQLDKGNWSVWVLAPLNRLNEAHTALRSTAEYLQGWWIRPDASITFSAPEIP